MCVREPRTVMMVVMRSRRLRANGAWSRFQMLLLVAVRVCASLYAYWCQVEELTPPKRPRLCDLTVYEKRSTSDWVGLRKLWHNHSRQCNKRAGPEKFSGIGYKGILQRRVWDPNDRVNFVTGTTSLSCLQVPFILLCFIER